MGRCDLRRSAAAPGQAKRRRQVKRCTRVMKRSSSPLTKIQGVQLEGSDVLSFHNCEWPESFEKEVVFLQKFNRPLICTEFMARSVGSTFDTVLPLAKKYNVGAINWGFVAGKIQTAYPWDSWRHPYIVDQPSVWFHELLYPDGRPYREAEAKLIRALTGRGSKVAPAASR